MKSKRRFVQVGLGGRGEMYWQALTGQYGEHNELVGLCDRNAGRLQRAVAQAQAAGREVPGFSDAEFDRMIAECRPDCVVVTTQDSAHDLFICRAMELGCDAITEKPMTIDEHRCRRIVDTQRRTGRSCRVTFNYRYSPPRTQMKDLLMSGVIGEITSVDFHWLLDTRHGADYFRRWHRNRANSGGLQVHKATHHFDLMNWWLSAVPETVYARGARNFYTPRTAERYGLTRRGERCLDCPEAGRCPFLLDMRKHQGMVDLYLEHEQHDGYFRDRCVFSDKIDIEDTLQVTATYDTGAALSYSLHAFMPWEGYIVCLNGTKGRIEHKCQETVYVSGDGSVPGALKSEGTWIRIYPHFAPAYEVEVWSAEGGHGGGDARLLDDILLPERKPDRYLRAADHRGGAYSILTGVAVNRSMERGGPVRIDELVPGLERPDYPPMPKGDEPLPLPEAVESGGAQPGWRLE
ncbi:MAG TPA: Gfo/Idh/MocA family oxidoreductase [Phycisphaerae bacterium]|nr:Gfo/Idh/MocA family oxidoreductase [Phycisphaerae bacterium]